MMKKKKPIRSEFIQDIKADKFVSHLDQFIRTSSEFRIGSSSQRLEPTRRQVQQEYEAAYKAVIRMSTVSRFESDKSLNHMVNFRFRLNGQSKGIPETDEKTCLYFRKIKKHQMELLAAISDEVAIIAAIIEESEKIRKIIQNHTWMLEKATYLMDVLGERIEKRPTPLLSVEGSDDKVRELNETFHDMNQYENNYEREFRAEAENHSPEKPFALYNALIQQAHQEIEDRKQTILSGIRELNEGWKFLDRLTKKGYSRRMRRGLDKMAEKHEQRASEFQAHVRKCRADYGISDEKPICKNEQQNDSDRNFAGLSDENAKLVQVSDLNQLPVPTQRVGTGQKKKRKKNRKK